MNNTQLTGADLFARYGVTNPRTMQWRYKETTGQPFDRNAQVPTDILAQLDAKWLREIGATKEKTPRKSYAKAQTGGAAQCFIFARKDAQEVAQPLAQVAPIVAPIIAPVSRNEVAQETQQPAQISRNWRDDLADFICIGVVIFHAFLIAYDCATQWGTAGLIGGVLAFALQCLALLYATDNNKTRTSEWALFVVGLIDVAAWFVHSPTFQKAAELAKNGVSPFVTDIFAGALCLFSFTALYLYRDSKII